ncbi:MAG: tripartite tricarboxylate transporter substrate binding protein [Betaproteobacteria bacterium]|nr:tripartite tricarboxylate transporter substrate binding protein [Betaproteobacteria bacterium]PWB67153.1 MAG: ABC transporter substrate-binding protein [Betaproteobacteria bacterium]
MHTAVQAAERARLPLVSALLAASLACLAPFAALAQAWPAKSIRLVVPFPPGGGTDTFARPLAAKLALQLGQQVVIDNRGGAGGTIGADVVAKSAPDGYTFLVGAVHHTVAPAVYKSLPYDLDRDLLPVTGVAYVPDVLVVNRNVKAGSVQELVALAKASPGKLNYGSSGNGTTRHLAGIIFGNLAGISLQHVPYKGSGPAMTALLGGEIEMIFEGLGSAASHIRAGSIRALAVTSPKRSPAFPDIPTMAEAGIPGFESLSWYGLWAPAGTPPEIVQRLQAEVAKAMAAPDLKAAWSSQGAEPGGEPVEAFRTFVRAETVKWGKLARDAKVTVD